MSVIAELTNGIIILISIGNGIDKDWPVAISITVAEIIHRKAMLIPPRIMYFNKTKAIVILASSPLPNIAE